MKKNDLRPLVDLPTLDPHVLAREAATAARELLAEAAAANTTRSYAAALRYWSGWGQGRYGRALPWPVPEPVVIQFLVDHLTRRTARGQVCDLPPGLDAALVAAGLKQRLGPLSRNTVVHRLAVLSKIHQLREQPNPCATPAVKALATAARRAAAKRGERPRQKTALPRPALEALLATCDDSLIGRRDRALLSFGFASGGRRRSEIAAADLADLQRLPESGFIYRLLHSKTQQEGPAAGATPDKPILGVAALALETWLQAAGHVTGPIFRRVWGATRLGEGLSPAAVAAIVQRRAQLAGLEGDFGGHSLRSGFVTEGARQGISLPALMAMTDHRAVASVISYFQAGAAPEHPAARLLDGS
ncbi:site-specific integrase [Pseudoxanthomonas sp. PXM03]|uniref:site-specific integrase n=1 Tax=Pseudoxanthomonas sp. PXM03 TaxID=2769284 RepID=UPI0017816776|nr:site-specific integrase [Pseudoxanthomonas sp. PXM03]MBD9437331.1 site-specific integrase [Pseudoxanthomonas sp. PXM03]